MNIGICGAGTIASWISDILGQLNHENIVKYGVAGISAESCKPFAEKYGWQKIFDSYEELMCDPAVDLVYIAVPNQLHMDLCLMALEHGKNVVVEKPFAVNYKQANAMIEKAKEKGVFLSEALWPAFLPSRHIVDHIIKDGKIGTLTGAKIVSKANVMFMDRVKKLETGGGSLLDMGPYILSRMTSHFGTGYESVEGHFEKLETGVDSRDYYTVTYPGGIKIECISTIDTPEEEREEYCEIMGTEGSIYMNSVSNPDYLEIRNPDGTVREVPGLPPLIVNSEVPFVKGYEHEWMGFEKAIREGKTQTGDAPWEHTLTISKIMTELRAQAGVVFPFE
ncbi:MAG: Gfo/Idh/MocA family oxidoreductase [Lachnospiraceae bacterium]|nr:Gfo/Idh/MocA family oxidoreductase [Lachnospiraceae bacterium]